MNSSSKKNVSTIVVIILAAAIIGILVWSSGLHAPATVPNGPSSTTSSVSVSSTGGLGVSVGTTSSPTSGVWQTYTSAAEHLSFSYPPGWSLGPDVPISLDNFSHKYQADSIIPIGGAEIDIANTRSYGPVAAIVTTETMGDTVTATSSITVSGFSCTEVMYSTSYAPGYPSNNIGVYCPDSTNGLLYKIYLSYRATDPNGANYVKSFTQVLHSITFTN